MRIIRGRVFYQGRLESLSLGIDEEGRIESIRKILHGDDEVDHGDRLILPGAVDLHVHMRDPGFAEKEDFTSGTRSAAIGGVTTLADMPNTEPPVTSPAALERKTAWLRGRGAVDYLLYAAPQSPEAAKALEAAHAFKAFMSESTGGLQVGTEDLEGILRQAQRQGKLTVVHAEDPTKFTRGHAGSLGDHAAARPKEAEVSAMTILDRIRGDGRIHVAHVTCVDALDAVPRGMSCEVSPHHLFLDSSRPLGGRGKVNPPLRFQEDRQRLWAAFQSGRIDVVASDHAPHTPEEKDESFEAAPAGVPGVATAFPLLMRRARAGDLDLGRLVSSVASRPAEVLGIAKGLIEIGRDADLLVVDPRATETIHAKRLRYKCGWTPFEGMEACFPTAVYLRGEPIIEGGEPAAEGRGRLLAPF